MSDEQSVSHKVEIESFGDGRGLVDPDRGPMMKVVREIGGRHIVECPRCGNRSAKPATKVAYCTECDEDKLRADGSGLSEDSSPEEQLSENAESVGETEQPHCEAKGPNGLTCTRIANHDGRHVTYRKREGQLNHVSWFACNPIGEPVEESDNNRALPDGGSVGETDRFDESTNLQWGVAKDSIPEDDVHRTDENHVVLNQHPDDRYWLHTGTESGINSTFIFDSFRWSPDDYGGTLWLKQEIDGTEVPVAHLDWHVAFPRRGLGLVGEWFAEQIDIEEYRAGLPCPRDDCDAEALETGMLTVCESADCDFSVEGHFEDTPHDDQQELSTDGGTDGLRCPDCLNVFYDSHDESAITSLSYHLEKEHPDLYEALRHKMAPRVETDGGQPTSDSRRAITRLVLHGPKTSESLPRSIFATVVWWRLWALFALVYVSAGISTIETQLSWAVVFAAGWLAGVISGAQ